MNGTLSESASSSTGLTEACFDGLPEVRCVVLGPGFTGAVSGLRPYRISKSVNLANVEQVRSALSFDSLNTSRLTLMPYECGTWFEPCGLAIHSPRLDERESASDTRNSPSQANATAFDLDPIDRNSGSVVAHWASRVVLKENGEAAESYMRSVERCVGLIRRGDVFQVNLAHKLTGTLIGRPRDCGRMLAEALFPAFYAYVECSDDDVIISCSPERFIEIDRGPEGSLVRTDPIKGTSSSEPEDVSRLRNASKDQAELSMIMDLMRNDLGKIATPGSVRVTDPRRLEYHHGQKVAHAVGTIAARVRKSADTSDVLAATFPPGSVTGAPKVRAMQLINMIEPEERGPYCGSFVYQSGQSLRASVNIRTLTLQRVQPDVWDFGLWVGAGIVADSDPVAEWQETLTKAKPILEALTLNS